MKYRPLKRLLTARLVRPRPEGVRIIHWDGTETACRVMRSTVVREDGLTMWEVIAPTGVIFDPWLGDRLVVAMLPPRSVLVFETDYPREDGALTD
jgi:hypothetical protein